MATSSSISTVQFDTECPVCHSVFDDPKILPCAHVLCRKCVISVLNNVDNDFDSVAKCPVCSDDIVDTANISRVETFVDEMPNDLCLHAFLKCTLILKKTRTCQAHQSQTATSICLHCHDWLCSDCTQSHKKLSSTRNHRVENVESLTTELLAANLSTKCPVHEQEYRLYCCNHESVVCSLCDAKHDVHTPHRMSCSVVHLEEIEKKARDSLRKILDKIMDIVEAALEQAIDRLNQDLQKVHNSAETTLREIDEVCDSLVKSVDSFRESLKHALHENTKATEVKLENSKVTFERKRGKLKTHEQLLQRSAIATPGADIWNMTRFLETRVNKLDSSVPSDLHNNEPLVLLQLDVKKLNEAKRALDAQLTLCEIAFKEHSAISQVAYVSRIQGDGAEKPSFDAHKTLEVTNPSVTYDTISTSTGCETGYKPEKKVSAPRDPCSYMADEIVAVADGDGHRSLHGTRRKSEEEDGVPPVSPPLDSINLETDFTPYIHEDYEVTANCKRGRPVFSSTIKQLKTSSPTQGDAEGPLKNQLVKRFIPEKAERDKHLYTVVEECARQMRQGRQSSEDEVVYVWKSDTLSVDFNLPMGSHPHACVTDQLFLLGTHLPPSVLVIYNTSFASSYSETGPSPDNIAERVQEFTVKVARLLTTSLLNFCCCNFVLLPCTVDVAEGRLSADDLKKEVLEQKEFASKFYSKKQELDAAAVCELKKAVTALTSATRVPFFLRGIQEDQLLLMEPKWSAALSLAIDAFVKVTEVGVIIYTSETETKIKILVLEAARRLSFREEVAVLTNDDSVKDCISRLIEQAKEEHAKTLLLRRSVSAATSCVIYIDLSSSESGGACACRPRVFSVRAAAP